MRFAKSTWIVVAACLLSVGCGAVQNALYKSAIEKALHEDALTGKEPTPGHAAAMRQVDVNACPSDFRVAYMNHIHAWDEKAAVNQAKLKLQGDAGGAAVAGVLASLFGSNETPWSDHLRAEQEVTRLDAVATNDIKTTWEQVEATAAKYGVELPK